MDGHSSDFLLESSLIPRVWIITSNPKLQTNTRWDWNPCHSGFQISSFSSSPWAVKCIPGLVENNNHYRKLWTKKDYYSLGFTCSEIISIEQGSGNCWGAHRRPGLPKVHCKKCRRLFTHPSAWSALQLQHGMHSLNRRLQHCTSNDETNQPSKRIMDYIQGQSVCLHQIKK